MRNATTAIATLLTLGLIAVPSALGQEEVRINEVDYEDQWVELHNTGTSAIDVSGYYLCSFPAYEQLSNLTTLVGSTTIPAGDFLVVEWTASNFTTSDGEVGLYVDDDFDNSASMADYMQYGEAGHTRESVAVEAGEWDAGEFVDLAPSGKTVSFFNTQGEVGEEDWEASNETQGEANDPIPVELTSFDAVTDNHQAYLTWTTASETNNAGFEIQHEREGSFQQIGFVEGHGTTNVPHTYRYTARDLDAGTHVFRLKQIDFDGAFEYSPEVEVTVAPEAPQVLSAIHPNPARQQAQFTLTLRHTQPVTIAVYDVLGRRVSTIFDGTLSADQTHRFEIGGQTLANGFYLVRAEGARFTSTRRVTLIE